MDILKGYRLRLQEPEDEPSYVQLMSACGWEFDQQRLNYCHSRVIPNGWFVVTPEDSDLIIASAMALHNYTERSIYSGTLGWVGCLPEHRGNALGTFVTKAVINRLIEAGYEEIELYTEYFREAAIVSYFRIGFLPYLYDDPVKQVWKDVCQSIGHDFTPDSWPSGNNAFPNA